MALRLRRGTDAERLLITPLQGELIYTNDTKQLYAGDGTTAGGILVSADAATTLNALNDTDLTGKTNGDVLQWNGIKWVPATIASGVGDGVVEGSNYRINIVGDDSSILLNSSTGTFTGRHNGTVVGSDGTILVDAETNVFDGRLVGNVSGDIRGSVFGDDSTVLVDGVNSKIVGDIETTKEITVSCDASNNSLVVTGLAGASSTGPTYTSRSSNGTIAAPTATVGATTGDGLLDLHGEGYDGASFVTAGIIRIAADLDQTVATGQVPGRINFITANAGGSLVNLLTFNSAGNLGIGLPRPDEKLHVNGNAKVGGFVQFGSLTTTERDALTAANGMVIYNTTDNKFQGYENSSWANLI
jgi:hypothetical protein